MGLFSRKPKPEAAAPVETGPTPERLAELDAEIVDLQQQLGAADADGRSALLDRLGAAERARGDLDAAIGHFEASLAEREVYGPAYHALLELFEAKRSAAATAKDREGLDRWIARIDDHMAVSKRILRSNY
ncbi:hypothetical protein [Agrococcus jejuensis]|uniref:Tetratricopeptide repeat-containing protein n=1 Tax=Agrococcus jejuensis TaxID=399736 RepID=A0A1G8GYZ6_9MICO|nr:hypothetical protein [Agrococcus jejuensis]SDH99618.1 hypothetical protein SAMN04489720_3136 [Agrococcus jejuensis]